MDGTCRIAACAILAIAVVLLLPAGACSSGQAGPDVLAKVNGRKIMRSEVEKYYHNQTEGSPQSPSEEQAQSLRLSIVRELIDNEILMQRAEKLGLMATDEEVESKLNTVKAPYTKEEFDQRLKERKITLDDFRRDIRRSITIEKVVNKEISSKVNIVDADVTAYYNQHKAEFNLIEPQYHLAQILVTSQPNPQVHNLKNDKAQNEADARKKVQMIMHRLDSGEDFAAVAANLQRAARDLGQWRRSWFRSRVLPQVGSPGGRGDFQAQGRPVHSSVAGSRCQPQTGRVPHHPFAQQRDSGTTGDKRSASAAGHTDPVA